MQAMGAALAVGAGATASSGSATAQDSAAEGVLYGVASPALGAAALAKGVADWEDDLNTDVSADETIIHSQSVSEKESYDAHDVVFGNYLKDMNTVASLEARNAIANAWQDNLNSSEAYQAALEAVRSYYAQREKNHWEVVNKALVQHSHSTNTILAADGITDDFLSFFVDNSSNTATDLEKAIITPDRVETTITLHNGDEHTMESPEFHIQTTDGTNEFKGPLGEFLDSWDSSNEQFTVQCDDTSNTWTTNLRATVQSVGDPTDGGLASRTVFDATDVMAIVDEITSQSDRVTGNYSESFVSDLYAELDAGNIEPSDIRGAEGQVRFMAGTDDISSDAYRISMLQTLDMEQADLSKTASMTVTYDGFSAAENVQNQAENRKQTYSEQVSDTYRGMLFARDIPDSGLETGLSYAVGRLPRLLFVGNTSPSVTAIDAVTHEEVWSAPGFSGNIKERYLAVSPDRTRVAVTDNSSVALLDAASGQELWTTSLSAYAVEIYQDDSNSFVLATDDTNCVCFDLETGEQQWSLGLSSDTARGVDPAPSKGVAFVQYGNTNVAQIDVSDGSFVTDDSGDVVQWTAANNPRAIAYNAKNDVLALSCQSTALQVLDASDGSEVFNQSHSGNADTAETWGDYAAFGADGSATVVDLSSMEELWSVDTGNNPRFDPSQNLVWVGDMDTDTVFGYDLDSGTEQTSFSHVSALALERPQVEDPMVRHAVMYDAEDGEEIPFYSGTFTIDSMTDSEGNEVETTGEDWGEPQYDSYDSSEFVKQMEDTEDYQINEAWADDDSSIGIPGVGGDGGDFIDWVMNQLGLDIGLGPLSRLGDKIAGIPVWILGLGGAAVLATGGDD
ncbi:hypothetical protein C487_17420 [Natrinema pallidum DSM 3751]|uniref:Uncharacterized protein n=2 Tax=Natrinema pallidum TaxID=69527 RepID=L9YGI3_9EURY|nr:hypothetical protein C487_17420 [Natrinema pallidum DSM 3751]